jgi:hypothetical protein
MAEEPKLDIASVNIERVSKRVKLIISQLAEAGVPPDVDTLVALAFVIVCQLKKLSEDKFVRTMNAASIVSYAMSLLSDDPQDQRTTKVARTH